MTSTPAIVVEGTDDIKTYYALAAEALDKFEIYAVEMIDGFAPGCADVVKAIQELYALPINSVTIENFILGIIDRDVREFRNELPTEKAIFALKNYSIETDFVNEEVLSEIVLTCTTVTPDLVSQNFVSLAFDAIASSLLQLYYFSLEALRCALEQNYVADFKYSYHNGRRNEAAVIADVTAKQADLDAFAASKNLTRDFDTIKRIAKGKWLLSTFSDEVHKLLKSLATHCGGQGNGQCGYCKVGMPAQCTFKIRDGISNKTIYSLVREVPPPSSMAYIRDRISELSAVTA